MTPQTAVLIFAIIGAFLFFCSGFLLARLGVQPRNEAPAPAVSRAGMSGDTIRENEALRTGMETVKQARDRLILENKNLRRDYERLRRKADAYFTAARLRFASLKEEISVEKKSAADLISGKESTETALAGKIANLEAECRKLERELERVRGQLAAKSGELSDLKIEAAQLREERRHLKERCEALSLTKRAPAAVHDGGDEAPSPAQALYRETPGVPALASREGLGGALQSVALELAKMNGARCVVLADDLGLPVAGTGEQVEALAGIAAVFSNFSARLAAMLPFGAIDVLSVRDTRDLTITLQPFAVGADNLVLATLTTQQSPQRRSVERLLAQAMGEDDPPPDAARSSE